MVMMSGGGRHMFGAVTAALLAVGFPTQPGWAANPALPVPRFRFETAWLKLPPGLATGEIVSVAVDRHDHLWVLHRPRTVKEPQTAHVAPPIMEFDASGHYLRGFGGPDGRYEWPSSEHTLALSSTGDIWITGNNRDAGNGDDMILVFDRDGHFLRQLGHRGATKGNYDRENFHAPADIFVNHPAHEVYVADGYGNQRVVVLSERDGRFLRMWGAFGKSPPRTAAPVPAEGRKGGDEEESFTGVHGVELSHDGILYVSDRGNQRIQAFTPKGHYLGQVSIDRDLSQPLTTSGMTFSHDPGQKYLFAADWGNGDIVVVDRKALKVIGTIGKTGEGPGEFRGPHLIDTDSKGVIYVAEVQGRRVQRLIPVR